MRDSRHFAGWVRTDYGRSARVGPGARGNTRHSGTRRGQPGGRGPCLRGACCDSSGSSEDQVWGTGVGGQGLTLRTPRTPRAEKGLAVRSAVSTSMLTGL